MIETTLSDIANRFGLADDARARQLPERETECSIPGRSASLGCCTLAPRIVSSLSSRLVGEDPEESLVEEIAAVRFGRWRHAIHVCVRLSLIDLVS